MRSVRQGLQEFIQSLELTGGQQGDVNRQHTEVRQCLIQRLQAKTAFLAGSYSRDTSIRPLHDVDIFAVLREVDAASASSSTPGGLTTDAALKQLRQALYEEWKDKGHPRLQRHSVHIGFTGTGVEFDVLPALEVKGQDCYLIPQRDTDRWIRTNPRRHQELAREANTRSGNKLKPLLKAVKHWKTQHAVGLLRSFHLEAMSYSAFSSAPGGQGYLEPLEMLFSHLSQRVLRACPDPANLGGPLDGLMTHNQRTQAHQLLESAAYQVQLARKDDEAGNPGSGHDRLGKLFGSFYRKS